MLRGHAPFSDSSVLWHQRREGGHVLSTESLGRGRIWYDICFCTHSVCFENMHLTLWIFYSLFCTSYDFTSVIQLYIFSTYFVLTPFLRGLRFHAAQVQTTGSLIHLFRIPSLLFWGALFFRAHLLVQSVTAIWICTLFWVWRGPVPSYDYDMFCRGLWIYLCGFCTYVWGISFYAFLLNQVYIS